eukprot:gene7116-9712_t
MKFSLLTILLVTTFANGFILTSHSKSISSSANLSRMSAKTDDKPKSKTERKPWEFGRFLRTAGFYGALTPKIPFLSRTKSPSSQIEPRTTIWDSNNIQGVEWGPLDDVVMGGASKSDLSPGEKFTGRWTGVTTSANNGGFAGIRTKLFKNPLNLSKCTGIELKVTGDGNRYKFIIRDDDEWNGTAWSTLFDTEKGKLLSIKLPFNKFKPTRFARVTYQANPFKKESLTALQISLSKFEYDGQLNPKFKEGPFDVLIESITSY